MKLILQIASGILLAAVVLGIFYRIYTAPSKDELDRRFQKVMLDACADIAKVQGVKAGQDCERDYFERQKAHGEPEQRRHCAAGTVPDDKGNCWAATPKQ